MPTFYNLPQEIRDQIFLYLTNDIDCLNFIRAVSKAGLYVNEEMYYYELMETQEIPENYNRLLTKLIDNSNDGDYYEEICQGKTTIPLNELRNQIYNRAFFYKTIVSNWVDDLGRTCANLTSMELREMRNKKLKIPAVARAIQRRKLETLQIFIEKLINEFDEQDF